MRAKSELFLYQCLWVTDALFRPSWRNLDGSFEAWAYRSGFIRQVKRLEAEELVEADSRPRGTGRVVRLTQKATSRLWAEGIRWNAGIAAGMENGALFSSISLKKSAFCAMSSESNSKRLTSADFREAHGSLPTRSTPLGSR